MTVPYKGLSYPFRFNSGGSTAMTELSLEDYSLIKESLYQIWTTRKGERVMLPEYGIDYAFNFEAVDDITELALLKDAMLNAAAEWEPRVTVIDVEFSVHPTEDNTLIANADVVINKYQASDTIAIPLTQT